MSIKLLIELFIEEEVPVPFLFPYQETAKRAVQAVLEAEQFPCSAEISLLLTGDEKVRILNRDFRNMDRETDVLSFPMQDFKEAGNYKDPPPDPSEIDADTGGLCLGDIVLSVPKVLSQAEDYGHSVEREFAFLIVHSMLHLLGYDHIEENDRLIMEDRQQKIMEALQILR